MRYLTSTSHNQDRTRDEIKEKKLSDSLTIVREHEWAPTMLIGGRRNYYDLAHSLSTFIDLHPLILVVIT